MTKNSKKEVQLRVLLLKLKMTRTPLTGLDWACSILRSKLLRVSLAELTFSPQVKQLSLSLTLCPLLLSKTSFYRATLCLAANRSPTFACVRMLTDLNLCSLAQHCGVTLCVPVKTMMQSTNPGGVTPISNKVANLASRDDIIKKHPSAPLRDNIL